MDPIIVQMSQKKKQLKLGKNSSISQKQFNKSKIVQ